MERKDSTSSTESALKEFQDFLLKPGDEVEPPEDFIAQLRERLTPKSQTLSFFGGQPVSLNKTQLNSKIFSFEIVDQSKIKEMDYIICQKTDGVRYILVVTSFGQNYFMARQTTKDSRPIFYRSKARIATNYDMINVGSSKNRLSYFDSVVEILDGELCIDRYKDSNGQPFYCLKYLVFDILVHHRQLITNLPLSERLQCAQLFVRGNNFGLQWSKEIKEETPNIEIQMKDFFQIYRRQSSNPDPRTIQFMFETYIPCLPHENDGIIFNNKKKEYVIGTTEGYMKWKPPEQNTVDFLGVPNTNVEIEDSEFKILDLYLSQFDPQSGTYTQLFAGFLAVNNEVFDRLQELREAKTDQVGEYVKGVVIECNFIRQQKKVEDIYKELYSIRNTESIMTKMMLQRSDQVQQKRITKLQSQTFDKYWNFLKCREDRSMGNNAGVADNIEKTISEDITKEELMKTSSNYFNKITEFRRRPQHRHKH